MRMLGSSEVARETDAEKGGGGGVDEMRTSSTAWIDAAVGVPAISHVRHRVAELMRTPIEHAESMQATMKHG